MTIQHITELFSLDGKEFVTEAYRNLLNREPDAHGMAYYLGRLAQGLGKDTVISQLAKSSECKPHEQVKGLKQLIKDRRRSQHWFWRRFIIPSRVENILQSSLFVFERIAERESVLTEQVVQVQRELSTLHDSLALQDDHQQAKNGLEKKNEEIFHIIAAQQEEIQALNFERRQKENYLIELTAQRESELTDLYQTKETLEKKNEEILHNFFAQQEEMEVLILERRESKNVQSKLEQQKSQLEKEKVALLKELDVLRTQRATLQQERDEQAWYAAERLAWLEESHTQAT